ncbi:MAG: tetratricopeptide repeat protein, partial [Paramuribaculum sp.]|nr:tetratricopeptide repeat protein [Paramuribaculum sp.]
MNTIRRYITVAAAVITGIAAAVAQINVDQVIRVGRNALYFEDYVLSIQYFNKAITAKPYLAQPYFYRAMAKYSLDDMSGAEADATLAIDRNPFITDAYELRGVARHNTGDLKGAIADYNKVLSMMPVNKGVLYNLAMAQQEIHQPDSAEATFRRLFELAPGYERAYLGYARFLLEKGDTATARENVDLALKTNKFNVGALLLHANLAMKDGKEGYTTALA